MEAIRVFVVDDHPVVRQGLRSLLSSYPDIEVVGEADNGFVFLEQVADVRPDVVLLDIRLGGVSGIEVAYQLRRVRPQTKIIMLTTYDDEEYLYGALRAGAHGYLLKSISHEVLASSIRSVHRGERLLSPELVGKVLQRFEELAKVEARYQSGLSELELQVLALMAEGATNKEIAEKLYWSEVTVKRKIQDILTKLEAANRTQAVAEAIRRGLI
ncbi:MAG: response regulator [Anaerolineae bacterium]